MKKHVNTAASKWLQVLTFLMLSIPNCWSSPIDAESLNAMSPIDENSNKFLLLPKLKRVVQLTHDIVEDENELTKTELELERLLMAKVRNQRMLNPLIPMEFSLDVPEMLPAPSAMVHPGPTHSEKRINYMALCHFKICNMGRKRHL